MSWPPLAAALLALCGKWSIAHAAQILPEASRSSFLQNREFPLHVLSFLQWNIHSECFLSCNETKVVGHCDASYPKCRDGAIAQLKNMLNEGSGALDFAGIEQLSDEHLTKNEVDPEWGKLYHTCGGERGFGASPFDIATLLFRKSRWRVKQVNGTSQKPFGGCMERNGQGEGPNDYRAFLGQAFVHVQSSFEVVVVVAHFPHVKRYQEEIKTLSAALTDFRKDTGIDQVVLLADTNQQRTSEEIMADIYPDVGGVTGSALHKTCCYPIYLHAFDRVIAGGFPKQKAYMHTVFPFGTEASHVAPEWAIVNMHDPVIAEFSLGDGTKFGGKGTQEDATETQESLRKSGAIGRPCLHWSGIALMLLYIQRLCV